MMILMRAGYLPSEEVSIGDEVFTHARRRRRVTATMDAVKPLIAHTRAWSHKTLRGVFSERELRYAASVASSGPSAA